MKTMDISRISRRVNRFRSFNWTRIEPMSAPPSSRSLNNSRRTICATPWVVGDKKPAASFGPPLDICWYQFINATIDSNSSFVWESNRVYLQNHLVHQLRDDSSFEAGFVPEHNSRRARVELKTANEIDRGIAVCGVGAFNWYHWVMEVLPRVSLAERLPVKYDDWPLIVPGFVRETPQFLSSLHKLCNSRQIVFAESGPISVGDLLWIDSPSISPFNIRNGWPRPEHSYHHEEAIAKLVRSMRDSQAVRISSTPSRIFLVRPQDRRSYNQDEVRNLLEEFGFVPISPELMELDAQVTVFGNAELIAGASGAAWTNLLFARPGAKGLIWAPTQYRGFNVFANLAQQSRATLAYHLFPSNIASTGEAYNASYRIDLDSLRRSLDSLLA